MNTDRNLLLSQCLEALGLVLEYDLHDKTVHQHAIRVGQMCAIIAEKVGLPPHRIQQMYFAGLIHDIGKVAIGTNILMQKRKLTEDEFKIVKMHSVIGGKIASSLPELSDLSFWIRWHHEKWDGSGYPDRSHIGPIEPHHERRQHAGRHLPSSPVGQADHLRHGRRHVGPRIESQLQ